LIHFKQSIGLYVCDERGIIPIPGYIIQSDFAQIIDVELQVQKYFCVSIFS